MNCARVYGAAALEPRPSSAVLVTMKLFPEETKAVKSAAMTNFDKKNGVVPGGCDVLKRREERRCREVKVEKDGPIDLGFPSHLRNPAPQFQ